MKNYWWIGGIIVVVALLLVWGHIAKQSEPADVTTVSDNATLPGIQSGVAPWAPEIAHLKDRLSADGLPALSEEGTVLHIHQHLDLFVSGLRIDVPPDIGIDEAAGYISPIHVHDTTGIIHVESPFAASFTLGQFFDVWGVRFSQTCIGGYCTDDTHQLRVTVNGKLYGGDLRTLVLDSHQEIVIAYGADGEMPKDIPPTFSFPEGY